LVCSRAGAIEPRAAFLVPGGANAHEQQGSYWVVGKGKNVVERRRGKAGPPVDSLGAIDEGPKGTERGIGQRLLKAAPGRQVTPEQEGGARPPEQGASPSLPPRKARP